MRRRTVDSLKRQLLERRYPVPALLLGLVILAFVVGHVVRETLGDTYSLESARVWVATLGWQGPVIYVAMLTFRQFLFLPSALVLSVGGLCFGVLGGTLLGATGIVLSGSMKFALTRGIARAWVTQRDSRIGLLRQRIEGAGPALVALVTAHPLGPMGPTHWAAGLTSIPPAAFVLALLFGGPLRAAAFSLFGSSLVEGGSIEFYVFSAVLLGAVLLPFAHPSVRRYFFTTAAIRND